jgi:Tol biopolymer transport system component
MRGLVVAFLCVCVSSAHGSVSLKPPGVIAFWCGDYIGNVCAIHGDGRGLRLLARGQDEDRAGLAWSPDGRRLAFTRRGELWVMNADGSGQRRLTRTPAAYNGVRGPLWAPDGHRIAFVTDFGPGIEVVNVNGSGRRVLVRGYNMASDFAWSPDGTRFAYSAVALYVADGNGRHPKRLTPLDQPYGPPSDPVWSPDGRLIAFVASKTSYPANLTVGAVYTIWPDGTHLKRLTRQDTGYPTPPHWSPKGDSIAFACQVGKDEERKRICVVRRDGSGFAMLSGPSNDSTGKYPSLSWSADGRWIAYDACAAGLCRLIVTPSSPGRWHTIGKPVYDHASPVWRP